MQAILGRTSLMMASSATVAGSGYIAQALLARILGPADFGAFNVSISVATASALLVTSGIPLAAARAVARDPAGAASIESSARRAQAMFASIVTAAFLVGSVAWTFAIDDMRLRLVLLAASSILPAYAWAGYLWNILIAHERYASQATTSIIGSMAKVLLAVGGGWWFGPIGAVAGYAGGGVVQATGASLVHRFIPHAPTTMRAPALGGAAREGLAVAVAIAFVPILDVVLAASSSLAASEVGFYAAASTLARVPLLLTAGLALFVFPAAARGLESFTSTPAYPVVRLLPYGLGFVGIAMVGFRSSLVPILFGTGFDDAIRLLPMLTIAGTTFAAASLLCQILYASGHGRIALIALIAGGCAIAVFGLSLEKSMGAAGFALGAAAGGTVAVVLAFAALGALGFKLAAPWIGAGAILGLVVTLQRLLPVGLHDGLLVGGALALAMMAITTEWRRSMPIPRREGR